MKNNKIFISFSVIFGIIIVSSVVYASIQKNNILDIVLEKKYIDESFGYSIQYPSNLQLYKQVRPGEIKLFNYDPSVKRSGHHFTDEQMKISTYIYENPNNLNLEDWFYNLPNDPDFKVTINSLSPTSVNGRQGLKVNMTDYFGITSESTFIKMDRKVLEIGVVPANQKSLKIVNTIVHSLQ